MFAIFRKLGWFFRLRAKTYAIGVIALVLVAIFSAITPLIIGSVIDQITGETLTQSNLFLQVGLILLLAVIMYALRYVWRVMIFTNSTLLESVMRNRLFDHFTKMDNEFFNNYRTGDLMAHATNDLAALRFVAGGGVLTFTDSIVVGGTTLFSMFFFVDWQLTLLTILPFPLLIVIARFLGKIINKRFRRTLEAFARMNNHVQESIAGMRVFKSFGEEKENYEDFTDNTDNVVHENKKVYQADSAYEPGIESVIRATYILTIFFGTYFIAIDQISIGQLVAYFNYLSMMAWPLLAVGDLANTLERGNVSYDRVTELLSVESHIKEAKSPVDRPVKGDIDFDVDSFTYPGGSEPLLEQVRFYLREGETLGLVGKTGSGKSSVFRLLMREYDNYKGKISYGGINVKDYSTENLDGAIGYVSQNNFLFSTTIRENIRFGNPSLSQEEVEYYAKIADVHDDITRFPGGYDTEVGEQGVSLSGGQKQRIAIARALAVDPEYLFLDDSLSAVDTQTESRILTHLKDLQRNRSTIISAHRIGSIAHADQILVLEEGRVIGHGTHDELLNTNDWYRNMYEKQQLTEKVSEGGNE